MKSITLVTQLFVCILLSGCVAQQKYYKNIRYSGNIQTHLNRDIQYCTAIAQGMTPAVPVYIPQSPITTYGSGHVTDNYGNVYTGTYQQTTYPDDNMELLGALNSLSQEIRAANVHATVKARCLSELGWYEISQDEYVRSNAQHEINKKRIEEYNKAFHAKIQNDHPDFVILSKEKRTKILDDMQKWIKTKHYGDAEVMMKVLKSGNADDVSNLLTQYKKSRRIQQFN